MNTVVLGALLTNGPRPTFLARSGEQTIRVELDSSAVIKLANARSDNHVGHILDQKRALIREAPQFLLDEGFTSTIDGGLLVTVSAVDL